MVAETDQVINAKLNAVLSKDKDSNKHCEHEFPVHDFISGRVLCSRWEVWYQQEEISRGSFGRVSKQTAFSHRSNQLRAVKQVTCRTGSISLDYKRELNAVFQFSQSKVNSPCPRTVLDVAWHELIYFQYEPYFVKAYGWYMDEEANLLCIPMEYIGNGNLKTYLGELRGKSPVEEKHAGNITMQLLHGLDFMHKEGYTHRDMKPSVYFPF